MSRVTCRRVAVLHVREHRDGNQRYQRIVDDLNSGALRGIDRLGWQARLVATGDVGLAETLAAVRGAELLVIMGGEDVHPRFYDGDADYEGGGMHSERADEAQIAAVQEAVRLGTPTLGICRGHQLLNVALGGGLIQHLGTGGPHQNSAPGADDRFLAHTVRVEPAVGLDLFGQDGAVVQSSHHQAVGALGTGLRVAARGEDGIVEAIVHESAPVTGVQWHPEHARAAADQFPALLHRLESQLR